ncbi:MAG: phage holin family protein [Rhodoglobus sp.]
MTGPERPERKRSLFALIGDIPRLITDLVRSEIEGLQKELIDKAKHAGVGIGLLVGAGAVVFFAIGVFTAAGILALSLVLPAWAAALIVGGALLLIAALLVAVGITQVKRGTPPTPTKTIDSIKQDVRAIKGIRKRATS